KGVRRRRGSERGGGTKWVDRGEEKAKRERVREEGGGKREVIWGGGWTEAGVGERVVVMVGGGEGGEEGKVMHNVSSI
ncbi:hypothetical protein M5110_09735, partial [Neisseria meningitidis]|nr:hypothetical protein [Neisseria meningitidis]